MGIFSIVKTVRASVDNILVLSNIIHPWLIRWVLTALHCVIKDLNDFGSVIPPENVIITVGEHDLNLNDETGVQK